VAQGKYIVLASLAKEEGNADAFEEEVQRLLHIVDEGKGDTKVFGGRREVGDGVEKTRSIESRVNEALEDIEVAANCVFRWWG